jgi:hypothetical protein
LPVGLAFGLHQGWLDQSSVLAPVSLLMFEKDLEDLVSVEGVVHLATTLGVFLDTQGRRIFVPVNCMETPSQVQHSSQA